MSGSSLDFYREVLFPSLVAGVRVAGIFDRHLREAWRARSRWTDSFEERFESKPGAFRIHLHVASAGELEQGLGVRRAVDALGPDAWWSLSFSSPSGRHHFESIPEQFGSVSYLPPDRRGEIREFLGRIRPDLIIFIRYDVWPVLVEEARAHGIPMMLACATIGEGRLYAPVVRTLVRGAYAALDRISAVSAEEAERLRRAAPGVPVQVDGDARLDRMIDRADAAESPEIALVRTWIDRRRTIVIGSSWPEDERRWEEIDLPEGTAILLAPHRITSDRLSEVVHRFPEAQLLSALIDGNREPEGVSRHSSVLIVDRLGLLADLYRLGDLAWVGGGYGAGVHSVAEPASFGLPVLSGPAIDRSHDARSLQASGGLRIVSLEETFSAAIIDALSEGPGRHELLRGVTAWIEAHRGGADRIARTVIELLERKKDTDAR